MRLDRLTIRTGIVGFWAVWLLIVATTNSCDGLKALKVLPAEWMFASGNYKYMLTVTARYHFPQLVTAFLFLGVVCWEWLAFGLFACAALQLKRHTESSQPAVHAAFAVGLALWAVFVIMDEIFIVYNVEATHMQLFIAQLVSLYYVERGPQQPACDQPRE